MTGRFNHWTPRYIRDRMGLARYERQNPDAPWLTAQMIDILSGWLTRSDSGVEWGSGRSTAWLAGKVAHVTTIEDNADWADHVDAMLSEKGLSDRVSLHLAPITAEERQNPARSQYVRLGGELPPGSLNFALVDGDLRDHCAAVALDLLKPGGVLIIDNVERYLPREALHAAPNARRLQDGCESAIWSDVEASIKDWRKIWTSNGVTETAFWVKPC